MIERIQLLHRNFVPLLMLLVLSCKEGGSGDPSYEGFVKIEAVDAASALKEFKITITHIEFHRVGFPSDLGWTVVTTDAVVFNLIQLRNGVRVKLTDSRVETFDYDKIRLFFGSVTVRKADGVERPVSLGASTINGFVINFSFRISAQQSYQLIFDFDASRSAKEITTNQFEFDPVIRVQPTLQSGSISGIIVPSSAAALVTTVVDQDTVSTYADTSATNGSFQLVALPEGLYNIRIIPGTPAYQETTISAIRVHAQIDTSLGQIILH